MILFDTLYLVILTKIFFGISDVKKNNLVKGKTWTSDHSADCGYSSGPGGHPDCASGTGSSSLPSSPDGSEIACSDGFCNGLYILLILVYELSYVLTITCTGMCVQFLSEGEGMDCVFGSVLLTVPLPQFLVVNKNYNH